MRAFSNLVWEHNAPGGMVKLYGAQPTMLHHTDTVLLALATASRDGAQPNKITLLAPASTPKDEGFQQIHHSAYYSEHGIRQAVDGAILTEHASALCMPTGDCVTLALIHPRRVIAVHCGREQLKALSGCRSCPSNIVSSAFRLFSKQERAELTAFIIAGIAPEDFPHEDQRGQELVKPFLDTYGEQVFVGDPADGRIDLIKIIRHQCVGYGVAEAQIVWDGLNTRRNPNLASHREQVANNVPPERYTRNLIFVHKT